MWKRRGVGKAAVSLRTAVPKAVAVPAPQLLWRCAPRPGFRRTVVSILQCGGGAAPSLSAWSCEKKVPNLKNVAKALYLPDLGDSKGILYVKVLSEGKGKNTDFSEHAFIFPTVEYSWNFVFLQRSSAAT